MADEILDIVDRDENIIGQIARKDAQRLIDENLGFIRVADMFLLNSKGQVWIPTRTADKVIAPNGYDFSVGGHVEAGDDYMQTLLRETKEEINLDIQAEEVALVAKVIYEAEHYIQSLFLLRTDESPDYNPADFVAAKWIDPTGLIKEIDNGHPAKANLRPSLLRLQAYLAK